MRMMIVPILLAASTVGFTLTWAAVQLWKINQ